MTFTARITDDWLPLPAGVLKDMGLKEGDVVSIEVVDGRTAILTVQLSHGPFQPPSIDQS